MQAIPTSLAMRRYHAVPVSEDQVHGAVADALMLAIAPPGRRSPENVMWFSIEHRNAKNNREGANRKRRGVIAGVPDILVMHGHRYLWIELKNPVDGEPSKEQRRLHQSMRVMGAPVSICSDVGQVLAFLDQEGVPMRVRVSGNGGAQTETARLGGARAVEP